MFANPVPPSPGLLRRLPTVAPPPIERAVHVVRGSTRGERGGDRVEEASIYTHSFSSFGLFEAASSGRWASSYLKFRMVPWSHSKKVL